MSFASLLAAASARLSWRTVRELAWVAAGQGAALVGSMGLTKVVASRLGTEEYGRYALALTLAVLLNQFLLGPVTTAAIRYFAVFRDERRLPVLVAALRRIVGRITAGLTLCLVPAAAIVAYRAGATWALALVAAAAFGVAQNVYGLLTGLEIAARHRTRAAIHQAADPVCRLAGAALALWALGPSLLAALIGITAGQALVALSQALA